MDWGESCKTCFFRKWTNEIARNDNVFHTMDMPSSMKLNNVYAYLIDKVFHIVNTVRAPGPCLSMNPG